MGLSKSDLIVEVIVSIVLWMYSQGHSTTELGTV